MQILITHGTLARTRVLHFNRWQLGAALAALIVALTLHWGPFLPTAVIFLLAVCVAGLLHLKLVSGLARLAG